MSHLPLSRFIPTAVLIITLGAIAASTTSAQNMSPRAIARRVDSAMKTLKGIEYSARFVHERPGRDTVVRAGRVYYVPAAGRDRFGGRLRLETADSMLYTYDGINTAILDRRVHHITVGDTSADASDLIESGKHSSLIPRIIRFRDTLARIIARAVDAEDLGTVTDDGIACRRLKIYHHDNATARNYVSVMDFGLDDWIPRRIETTYDVNSVPQREELTFSRITLGGSPPDNLFQQSPRTGDSVIDYAFKSLPLLPVASPAPEWNLRDSTGAIRSLCDYKGRILILDFWFTTCGPCLQALPTLQRIADKYAGRGVTVLGVDCSLSDTVAAAAFLRQRGIMYETLEHGRSLARKYRVEFFPSIYVIGRDGMILHTERGYRAELESELSDLLDRLLAGHK